MTEAVMNLPLDPALTARTGPLVLDRRSRLSGLTQLSAGFIDCPDGGRGEPWTLPYEEILVVLQGTLTLHVESADPADPAVPVVVRAGEMASIEQGATVVYEGEAGTRAFYALAPADWLERDPAAWAASQAQATTP